MPKGLPPANTGGGGGNGPGGGGGGGGGSGGGCALGIAKWLGPIGILLGPGASVAGAGEDAALAPGPQPPSWCKPPRPDYVWQPATGVYGGYWRPPGPAT